MSKKLLLLLRLTINKDSPTSSSTFAYTFLHAAWPNTTTFESTYLTNLHTQGFHEVLKTVGIVTVGMVLSELGIVSAILKMDCVTPSLNPCHSFNEDSSDAYSYTSQGPSEVYDTTKNLTDLSTCQLSFDKHGCACML